MSITININSHYSLIGDYYIQQLHLRMIQVIFKEINLHFALQVFQVFDKMLHYWNMEIYYLNAHTFDSIHLYSSQLKSALFPLNLTELKS